MGNKNSAGTAALGAAVNPDPSAVKEASVPDPDPPMECPCPGSNMASLWTYKRRNGMPEFNCPCKPVGAEDTGEATSPEQAALEEEKKEGGIDDDAMADEQEINKDENDHKGEDTANDEGDGDGNGGVAEEAKEGKITETQESVLAGKERNLGMSHEYQEPLENNKSVRKGKEGCAKAAEDHDYVWSPSELAGVKAKCGDGWRPEGSPHPGTGTEDAAYGTESQVSAQSKQRQHHAAGKEHTKRRRRKGDQPNVYEWGNTPNTDIYYKINGDNTGSARNVRQAGIPLPSLAAWLAPPPASARCGGSSGQRSHNRPGPGASRTAQLREFL